MAKTRPGWFARVLAALILVTFLCITPAHGHTSVERLLRIAPNGTTIRPEGFPRGFWPRGPGYSDEANVYLIPPNGGREKVIYPDDKLAHPSQRTSNYSSPYLPLTAAPGDAIALEYQENGHVSIPTNQHNKPENRGTVYIYGASDFDGEANLLDVHYQWNANGTGGNGKGKLLATRNYDDSRCHQDNNKSIATGRKQMYPKPDTQPMGTNLWCQNDLILPTDLPVGKPYTLIWVWDWPTMNRMGIKAPPSSAPGAPPGADGGTVLIPELYTTVMDLHIVGPCDDALGEVKAPTCTKNGQTPPPFHVTETDYNVAAFQDQLDNMFMVDVTANLGTYHPDPPSGNPGPESLSSGSSSQPSATRTGGTGSTGSGALATTTTTTASQPTTTLGRANRVSTTTVYDSITVTTVTVYPSSTPSNPTPIQPALTTKIEPSTLTKTETTTLPASSTAPTSKPTTAASSGSPSSILTKTGVPTVTHFLKSTKPTTAVNKGRRQAGEWGFGRHKRADE